MVYVRLAVENTSHYSVMLGGLVEQERAEQGLDVEAAGALQGACRRAGGVEAGDLIVRGDDTVKMTSFV